jgi:hypothetical protein
MGVHNNNLIVLLSNKSEIKSHKIIYDNFNGYLAVNQSVFYFESDEKCIQMEVY